MAQNLNVCGPGSTKMVNTTRQSASSGPPVTRRAVVSFAGGVTQAQPPFTEAVPAGQVTSSLTFRMSEPLGGSSVAVRSTIWRPVPPGGFAAATVAPMTRMAATTTTTNQGLRMAVPSLADLSTTSSDQVGQVVTYRQGRTPQRPHMPMSGASSA